MIMDRCPGKQSLRNLDSTIVPCPDCGRLMEFFSDEARRHCRCGRLLLREPLPQCADWCPAAAECMGQVIDAHRLEQRLAEVKDDPRARACLEKIRKRLQEKRQERSAGPESFST